LAAFAWASVGAGAADGGAVDTARIARERVAIQSERDRLEAQFAAEQARCAERFAVTACLDDVRDRRRAALEAPRARALALDDADRKARAAARREAVAQKQRGTAERLLPARGAASIPTLPVPKPPPAGSRPLDTAAAREATASAAATAAARRADAARARQAAARAEQTRIATRQAERARQGKAASPLPVPASASRARPAAA
jgi:hypothetical protein